MKIIGLIGFTVKELVENYNVQNGQQLPGYYKEMNEDEKVAIDDFMCTNAEFLYSETFQYDQQNLKDWYIDQTLFKAKCVP